MSSKSTNKNFVATTVQEVNITHPTDSKLYHAAIVKLARAAEQRGVTLRQTYMRVAKQAAISVSRYAHAEHSKRMRRKSKKLKTWLGRVLRDLRRKVPELDHASEALLGGCEPLRAQERTDSKKLDRLHEPDVQCISKGKA